MASGFTVEEFNIMVDEVLCKNSEESVFDMLAEIAEKTLRNSVYAWCMQDSRLRGRDYEGDIMQKIHLRLKKTVVDYFLLRDDIDGPYNNDPEGFRAWMFTVANNIKKDFAESVGKEDSRLINLEDCPPHIPAPESSHDIEERDEHREILKKAFSIVLSSDVKVYKVLTWVAQFLFVASDYSTKIESSEVIVDAFQNKTLYDMYSIILDASSKIPWIVVTEEQNQRIVTALQKKYRGDVTYGQTKYSTFFMKNKGKVDGKKSISDWSNRINDIIRRKTGLTAENDRKSGMQTDENAIANGKCGEEEEKK